MSHDNDDKYTNPELRRRIKDELMQSDKGGAPGQWSARKSQLLVQEYERQGGAYTTAEKDAAARSLEAWTAEDWQTVDGDERARHGDTTERYLPKAVWDRLSDAEKREAERSKEHGSAHGEQHVDWPPAVKRAMQAYEQERQHASSTDGSDHAPSKQELLERAKQLNISGRSTMTKDELAQAVQQAEA